MEQSVAKAITLKQLTKKAKEYFFRPVKLSPPFVTNATGTGVIPYYTVEKKKKFYHLIKLIVMGTITFTKEQGIAVQDKDLALWAKVLKPEIHQHPTALVKKSNSKAKTGYDICRGTQITELLFNNFMYVN